MIINGQELLRHAPIRNMVGHKVHAHPTSWGLTECGYDIRIKQDISFKAHAMGWMQPVTYLRDPNGDTLEQAGSFILASSIEEFNIPTNLMGRILNKSSWARKGVDASMTTNAEPGWNGHLTIELTFKGMNDIHIPAGSGICQVIFETLFEHAQYVGRYQNQADHPVSEIQFELGI